MLGGAMSLGLCSEAVSSPKGLFGAWYAKAPSMGSTNHDFITRSSWRSRPGNKQQKIFEILDSLRRQS